MAKLSGKFTLTYVVRLACTPWNNLRFTAIIPIRYAGHYNSKFLF